MTGETKQLNRLNTSSNFCLFVAIKIKLCQHLVTCKLSWTMILLVLGCMYVGDEPLS